ncbi:uncharacterized protein LOC134706001 [Mytilus trossulus]|uniref:uncharacterized protein LOC134706001 n=1 Tax=Mytilus trossulus TaxID=6551 RepID=UPI00300560E5
MEKSTYKAQDIATCQFCDGIGKSKCLHCNITLCDGCQNNFHRKIRSSGEHKVIDLKELYTVDGNEVARIIDIINIECANHKSDKKAVVFCRGCKIFVCFKCFLQEHKSHDAAEIKDVYREKKHFLEQQYLAVEQDLHIFSTNRHQLEKMKKERDSQLEDVRMKIEQKRDAMTSKIEKHATELVEEANKMWEPQEVILTKQQKKNTEIEIDLSQRKEVIENALLSQTALSIFTASDEIHAKEPLPKNQDDPVYFNQMMWTENKPIYADIAMGLVVKIPELKTTKTLTSDVKGIVRLDYFNNEMRVLFCPDKQCLKTFTIQDGLMSSEMLIQNVKVLGVTHFNNNKLLISSVGSSKIEIVHIDGNIETFTSIPPFYIRGIYTTEKNVMIGFMDKGTPLQLTEDSRRGIMILDMKGTLMRMVEYDVDNKRLFSVPAVIKSNINGDICVVDTIHFFYKGRVVVLGAWGNLKWIYNGHPSINGCNETSTFTPSDIATTTTGFVLVTDFKNDTIHVLSINGDFLSHFSEKDVVARPLSLYIDNEDNILIGCSGSDEGLAKLHVATFLQ